MHITKNRVLETTVTTGTGALTLGGAVTGFRTFGSVMASSSSDTCYYEIWGVDSSLNATGEYEAGLGTYSAIGTLTRTTVLDSSNAGAAVNFSAGTKLVAMSLIAEAFRPLPSKVLASDYTNSTTTLSNITGLAFEAEANATYIVDFIGALQSAANTTGLGLAIDVPASASVAGSFFHQLANTGTLTGGSQIADTASVGVSSGAPTNATTVPVVGKFIVATGANGGTCQLQGRGEVAAQITLKAGLTAIEVRRIA